MTPTRKQPPRKTKPIPNFPPIPIPPPSHPPLNTQTTPKCEYPTCNLTTTTPRPPLRKLISHVFGRNKTTTKRIPDEIWVHYCRKHYQRARYRSHNWAREQCELLLVSLDRLEGWGGVGLFRIVLRRREDLRRRREVERREALGLALACRTGGDDVRGGEGDGGEEEEEEEYPLSEEEGGEQQQQQQHHEAEDTPQEETQAEDTQEEPEPESKKRKQRIQPCPVPTWLVNLTKSPKTFDEMRAIIRELMEHFNKLENELEDELRKNLWGELEKYEERRRRNMLLFPDVEILPVFKDPSSSSGGSGIGNGIGSG
ncbi:hypothetical protein P168DRAFT_325501 [Aspergillus campestris IBT 28561]|uniref:Uncharacterized protein n=1 Tax=Aspergillus campestris (strain IBT 28561) TaxID=1392248 RepID=A0A2I1D9W8_ASPC2|nr:uncharacterized protein P168DRAFT_325501 [Aspergillus campestris IBT 28561]PKY06657.1 hypothetical protein P168DRAFT_325501 [Aspergillus campestris IBT 28561]